MIFVVLGRNELEFAPLIAKLPEGDSLNIGPAQWLVYWPSAVTSNYVWTRLMVDGGETKPIGFIFPLTSYYGLASSSVWEWIAAKKNAESAHA